jgi:hypothetical protein
MMTMTMTNEVRGKGERNSIHRSVSKWDVIAAWAVLAVTLAAFALAG